MSDPFDDFLSKALAPPKRDPDRVFVARVQARVLLDEALRAQQRGALHRLGLQLLALLAVAAAFLLLSRSPEIAAFVAESPAIVLAAMIALFSLIIGVLAGRTGSGGALSRSGRGFSRA